MTTAPPFGAPAHDSLASWSTATLADLGPVQIPGPADDPPHGWFEQVSGRGVFVRRTEPVDDETAPDAWYVHGLAGSSTNWTSLSGAMAATATGHLVDLPGHGRSDPPPRGRYSLRDDADVLAELVARRSRGPVHLVGNSLGGVVSTMMAGRYPELVKTLTLISPAVPDLRLTHDRGADPILGLLLLPGTTGLALRRLVGISPLARARGMGELCFGDPTVLTDHDYEVAAADLAWRSSLPWAHRSTIESLRALMRSYLPGGRSFRADAACVTVPTLVIWGTRDRLVDVRLARRTAECFADSRLLVIAGVGHTAQMEAPLVTARAVSGLWATSGAPHPGLTPAVGTSET
ncbi:alpha/beta fold hydrolase [Nakamurella panacisegetis]|uniref:alpha/beta fold hydrolase n=1 Tax=Nakamurella panacisegetis TaxID=1090615 RepID=UPI0012FD5133|nr:alpha/beta hydrolase [Nakamurella panacisegetis]